MKAQLAREPLKTDIQLARVTLKTKEKEQTKKIEKGKIKKRGPSLRILPRRNSFDDKTLHQVSSCNRPNEFWTG